MHMKKLNYKHSQTATCHVCKEDRNNDRSQSCAKGFEVKSGAKRSAGAVVHGGAPAAPFLFLLVGRQWDKPFLQIVFS